MKQIRNNINLIILLSALMVSLFSCNEEETNETTGFVTFGANYHVINCVTTLTIYIDDAEIGNLEGYTDSISECGAEENITKELSIGEHTYKAEVRPESGTGCTTDISGTFTVLENECTKIFFDYYSIFDSQSECDQDVVISSDEYENASGSSFTINKMEISGDCLTISVSASGCSGTSWEFALIDSENIAESYPCQRNLKLTLENSELCAAYITKEVSFNIEDLQLTGYDSVILNVSGTSILYEY